MEKLDLQLISVEDLSYELAKRFDGIIIHGIQKNPKNNNLSIYYDHYHGDQPTLIGLCEILEEKLKEDFNRKDKN